MSINLSYKTKKIREFLADLIHEYEITDYDQINDSHRGKFLALILEANQADYADHEWYGERLDSFRDTLTKALNGDLCESALGEALIEQLAEYYAGTMEELFNAALANYDASRREWLDYACKYGDPDTEYDKYKSQLTW
jgi:hypothetical protein